MLRKLMKHEWKSVSGFGLLMMFISLGIGLLAAVYFCTPLWKEFFMQRNGSEAVMIVGMLTGIGGFLTYCLMLFGTSMGLFIFLGIRYYKSMFSGEGYLTHTLPVTPAQLLVSKVLVAGIWTLLMTVLLGAISFGLLALAIGQASGVSLTELWASLWKGIDSFGLFIIEFEQTIKGSIIVSIINLILQPFLNVMILFGALNLGGLFGKGKGIIGILIYFGLRMVMAVLAGFVEIVLRVVHMTSGLRSMYFAGDKILSQMMVQITCAVALMLLSNYILKKSLNLE